MTLQFKKLSIKNFMSFDNAEISFDKEGFILIDAENHRIEDKSNSNGSGKSSLFEAMIWAITGETIRGHRNVYNKYISDSKALCEVSVDFDFKGHSWRIIRTKNSGGGQGLSIEKDGVLFQTKGVRDAQETVESQLPELTMKFLGSTVILGQGLPQRFTNNSPSGRKAVLEELSNADYMITHVKENIKRREESLQKELDAAILRVTSASAKIETNLSIKKTTEDRLAKLNEFDKAKAEEELKALAEEGKRLSEEALQLAEVSVRAEKESTDAKQRELTLQSELSVALSDVKKKFSEEKDVKIKEIYDKFEVESQRLNGEIQEVSEALRKAKEALEHKEAVVSGGYCRVCGQKLGNTSQEELDAAKSELPVLEENVRNIQLSLSAKKTMLSDLTFNRNRDQAHAVAKIDARCREAEENEKKAWSEQIEAAKSLSSVLRERYLEASRIAEQKNKLLSDKRSDYKVLRERIQAHDENVRIAKESIQNCENEISSLEKLKSSQEALRDNLLERLKVISSMLSFASRDFRGILLENIIAQLDSILHGYAEKVYGSPLTKFVQDGNAISISFDGKEYEALSGGEKQRLDVLIQLSLRDLIIQTSGVETNLLVFDEIFDALDITGCEAIMDVLINLGKQTFVITHRSKELSIPFDSTITVVKEANGIAHLEVSI